MGLLLWDQVPRLWTCILIVGVLLVQSLFFTENVESRQVYMKKGERPINGLSSLRPRQNGRKDTGRRRLFPG